MKCKRDLFKKKKVKTMNYKMAKNINPSAIESEKPTKQTRKAETESWIQRGF